MSCAEYYDASNALHNYADALEKMGYDPEFVTSQIRAVAQQVVAQHASKKR